MGLSKRIDTVWNLPELNDNTNSDDYSAVYPCISSPADPPPSSPVIEGYFTGLAMRAGETLEMTCSVHGGKPLVTSVTFSCPRHPDRTPDVIGDSGVTSVLEMKLTSSDDGALCRCSALWKSGSRYPQSSTRILVVKGTAGEP